MAYNQNLAARIRSHLSPLADITEKKMFGGVGFMVRGNMACGVIGENMVLRVPPWSTGQILTRPHTRPFDFSGKPMTGWIYVEPGGFETEAELQNWIQQGIDYARSLPAK